MNKGFTLLELLVTVMIIGILSSIALPNYTRSVEKARATEAMNIVKAANDAVYAYAAERNKCPESFQKILVSIPGTKVDDVTVNGKYFAYKLNAATLAPIFGTDCGGVVAERLDTAVKYRIWNPYGQGGSGKRTLACKGDTPRAENICKSLGMLSTQSPY